MAANTATCKGMIGSDVTVGGDRTYQVEYEVQTTDPLDQALTAMQAAGVPSIGQYMLVGNDADSGAFVRGYSASYVDRDANRKIWRVIVSYSSSGADRDITQGDNPWGSYEFPWLAPARLSGSTVKDEQHITWHYPNPSASSKAPTISSAGETYTDVYRERSVFGISMQIAYAANDWSPETCRPYIDKVNENQFFGAAQDYYKMIAPTWDLLYTGQGLPYWDVRYEFEGSLDGWNGVSHDDEGLYYIDRTTGKLTRGSDDWLRSLNGKVKLDGNGGRLGWVEGETHTEPYPPNGINRYLRADFGALNIPTSVEDIIGG